MKQFNQIVQFLHFVALWEKQPNIEIQCTPEPTMFVCVLWRFIPRLGGVGTVRSDLESDVGRSRLATIATTPPAPAAAAAGRESG